jgi:hypothetical protein
MYWKSAQVDACCVVMPRCFKIISSKRQETSCLVELLSASQEGNLFDTLAHEI